jgi:uncharacterized protein DUF4384
MKNSITITACLLFCAASYHAFAQDTGAAQPAGARDLYNTYGKSETAVTPSPSQPGKPAQGRPGVRVRIELDRDGRARWVSTRTVFRAGDKVRFHFAMNFPGYVAIINQGSSGRRSLLFPYEGVSNHIGRTADYTVPQGEGWFEFDDTPGKEQLTFIMSRREIQEVTQLTTPAPHPSAPHPSAPPAAPSNHPPVEPPTSAPPPPAEVPSAAPAPLTETPAPLTEAPAPLTEEQEILAALNSRSLTQGRDLKLVEENTDGYVLATDESLAKPAGFKLTLEHR